MRAVEIEGVVHEFECNAFTPFIYAEEFTVTRKGKQVHEDINAAIDEIMAFMKEHDFPPMLKLLQFFWAFEKTANPKVPRFKEWLKKLPRSALNLNDEGGWAKAVMSEINDAFFPGAPDSDVDPEAE